MTAIRNTLKQCKIVTTNPSYLNRIYRFDTTFKQKHTVKNLSTASISKGGISTDFDILYGLASRIKSLGIATGTQIADSGQSLTIQYHGCFSRITQRSLGLFKQKYVTRNTVKSFNSIDVFAIATGLSYSRAYIEFLLGDLPRLIENSASYIISSLDAVMPINWCAYLQNAIGLDVLSLIKCYNCFNIDHRIDLKELNKKVGSDNYLLGLAPYHYMEQLTASMMLKHYHTSAANIRPLLFGTAIWGKRHEWALRGKFVHNLARSNIPRHHRHQTGEQFKTIKITTGVNINPKHGAI